MIVPELCKKGYSSNSMRVASAQQSDQKMFYEVLKKGYLLQKRNASKQAYMNALTDTINTGILGSEHSHTTWRVPMTENNNDISFKISLRNE